MLVMLTPTAPTLRELELADMIDAIDTHLEVVGDEDVAARLRRARLRLELELAGLLTEA